MNRRRLLIALAVIAPLVLLVPAKIAASWRPVAVGPLLGARNSNILNALTTRVSERYLVASDVTATTRFDLQNGARTLLKHGGIAEEGVWMANLRAPKHGQMELSLGEGARTFAYPIKNITASNRAGFDANRSAQMLSRQTLRVQPDYVELVWLGTYFRWNRSSHALERKVWLAELRKPTSDGKPIVDINGFVEEKIYALSRDGERAISLGAMEIEWYSTRKPRLIKRLDLTGYVPTPNTSEQIQISNYGSLALYNPRIGGTITSQWDVRDTDNGRVLWKFALASPTNHAVFSSDEKWLALPVDNLRWEIRDARSGALARTLPRVPNVRAAAFSADGNTLYSVANGVLYRQRAR